MGGFPKFNILHYLYSMNRGGRWVAHCLDFDIVATAKDLEESESRLDTLVKRHLERFLRTNGACALDGSAPEVFWTRWTECLHGKGTVMPSRILEIEVPSPIHMPNPIGEVKVVEARAA